VQKTGDPLVPAYYLMGAALIGLLTMLTVRETAGMPLRGSPPAVANEAEAIALVESGEPVTVDRALPDLPPVAPVTVETPAMIRPLAS